MSGATGAMPLLVSTDIAIDAPAGTVWAVLTDLRSFKEWEEPPDEYAGDRLERGSELSWNRIDGGYTRLTVTAFEPERRLRLSLYASHWRLPPAAYDVAYTYSLAAADGRTYLSIEIGDFARLDHGEDFVDPSTRFAERAAERIKALAEGREREAGAG